MYKICIIIGNNNRMDEKKLDERWVLNNYYFVVGVVKPTKLRHCFCAVKYSSETCTATEIASMTPRDGENGVGRMTSPA